MLFKILSFTLFSVAAIFSYADFSRSELTHKNVSLCDNPWDPE